MSLAAEAAAGRPCCVCGADALEAVARRLPLTLRCAACGVFVAPGQEPRSWDGETYAPSSEGKRRLFVKVLTSLEGDPGRGRVLDYGFGDGQFLELAYSRGWQVWGMEPGAPARARMEQAFPGKIFPTDGGRIPFPDRGFDAVTIFDAIEYVEDPMLLLREVRRVLKPGGALFMRCRNARYHQGPLRPLLAAAGTRFVVTHRLNFGPGSLSRAVELAGFERIEVRAAKIARRKGLLGLGLRLLDNTLRSLFFLLGNRGIIGPSFVLRARRSPDALRVAHIITRLDFGGSAENTALSVEGLRAAGHHVDLLLGPGTGAPTAGRGLRGMTLIPELERSISPWRDLRAFFQIRAELKRLRPDIVHTHSSKAGILGRWAAWSLNKTARRRGPMRVIHTPHGHVFYGYFGPLKSAFFLWVERLTARVTDTLVALSSGERDESVLRGVGDAGQWVVIPSGVRFVKPTATRADVRTAWKRAFGVPDDGIVVGCVARLEPIKGVDVLVRAAEKVLARDSERRVDFVVVGDGPDAEALGRLVEELGLAGRFHFTGFRRDVTAQMSAMDLYVQPSINEGMGKTLVQAHHLGLAIAASDVCGIPDVVRDGKSGVLAGPGDPEALAAAIEALLADPVRRDAMGVEGRRWVHREDPSGNAHFGVESMIERQTILYTEGPEALRSRGF